MFPRIVFMQLAKFWPDSRVLAGLSDMFDGPTSFFYNLLYVVLIYFFCYFWTAITFNPKDMAENLKSFGTFIPGYRPGKRTADYLEKVMVRITYVGAGFLAVVAITPTVIAAIFSVPAGVASFFARATALVSRGETTMRIVFLGPPGVGKGTQAIELARQLGIIHLSTGEMLRQAAAARTPVGLQTQEFLAAGKLVPDDVMLDLVRERLEKADCRAGYVLDGFPAPSPRPRHWTACCRNSRCR
jgi:hypothetical protein